MASAHRSRRPHKDEFPAWTPLSPEEAEERVRRGFGSRPDWPPGEVFVRESRRGGILNVCWPEGYRAAPLMTHEEAEAAVEAAIGSRPDLPPGEDFVRELRGGT